MIDKLLNSLAFLKIQYRVLLSAGIILLLMVLVAMTALTSLGKTESQINHVVNERQPLAIRSLELADALDHANSALGFYLSSQEESHKLEYEKALVELDTIINELLNMPMVKNDEATNKLLLSIYADLQSYSNFKDRMIELAVDVNKNYPGYAYSFSELSPVAMELVGQLQGMMTGEADEEATEDRKNLLYPG